MVFSKKNCLFIKFRALLVITVKTKHLFFILKSQQCLIEILITITMFEILENNSEVQYT